MRLPTTISVPLNLFQGRLFLPRRSIGGRYNGAIAPAQAALAHQADWMLKQLQHDEIVREARSNA